MPETNYAKKLPTLPSYILDLVTSKPSEVPPWDIFTAHHDDSAIGSGLYPGKAESDILQLDNPPRRSGDSFGWTEPGGDVIGGTDSGLQLREVSEIPHKLYGVGMNQARKVLISAANIGGVWVQKRSVAVRE